MTVLSIGSAWTSGSRPGYRMPDTAQWRLDMDDPETGLLLFLLTTTNTHCSLADAQLLTKMPLLRVQDYHVKNPDSPLVPPALSFIQRAKTIWKSGGCRSTDSHRLRSLGILQRHHWTCPTCSPHLWTKRCHARHCHHCVLKARERGQSSRDT